MISINFIYASNKSYIAILSHIQLSKIPECYIRKYNIFEKQVIKRIYLATVFKKNESDQNYFGQCQNSNFSCIKLRFS